MQLRSIKQGVQRFGLITTWLSLSAKNRIACYWIYLKAEKTCLALASFCFWHDLTGCVYLQPNNDLSVALIKSIKHKFSFMKRPVCMTSDVYAYANFKMRVKIENSRRLVILSFLKRSKARRHWVYQSNSFQQIFKTWICNPC